MAGAAVTMRRRSTTAGPRGELATATSTAQPECARTPSALRILFGVPLMPVARMSCWRDSTPCRAPRQRCPSTRPDFIGTRSGQFRMLRNWRRGVALSEVEGWDSNLSRLAGVSAAGARRQNPERSEGPSPSTRFACSGQSRRWRDWRRGLALSEVEGWDSNLSRLAGVSAAGARRQNPEQSEGPSTSPRFACWGQPRRWRDWRRGWDSNPRMEVLQTSPLGHLGTAPCLQYSEIWTTPHFGWSYNPPNSSGDTYAEKSKGDPCRAGGAGALRLGGAGGGGGIAAEARRGRAAPPPDR